MKEEKYSKIFRHDTSKFCTIEADIYGNEQFVDEFIAAVKVCLFKKIQ